MQRIYIFFLVISLSGQAVIMSVRPFFVGGECQEFVHVHYGKSLTWARDFMRSPHGPHAPCFVHIVIGGFVDFMFLRLRT